MLGIVTGPVAFPAGGAIGAWTLGVSSQNNVTVNSVVLSNAATGTTEGIIGAVFSLNGGLVRFNGGGTGFSYGGIASSTNTNINLNGGVLDMNGQPILTPGVDPQPLNSFEFNGGTLKNASVVYVTNGLAQNGGILLQDGSATGSTSGYTAGTTTIGSNAAAPGPPLLEHAGVTRREQRQSAVTPLRREVMCTWWAAEPSSN
jgi:hypothetical protein